jgi:hypothetical protein
MNLTLARFKEVNQRDSFWQDLISKIPQCTLKRRFTVSFNIDVANKVMDQWSRVLTVCLT